MNKFIVLLIIATVGMSFVSGLLFYQLNEIQTENSELKGEIFKANIQLEEEQNSTLQLENQVTALLNQTEQLQQNLTESEHQNNILKSKIAEATNRVKITDFIINETSPAPPTGVGMFSNFFVTVENFGINDVEDLRVVFDTQYSTVGDDRVYNDSIKIGVLRQGVSRTVNTHIQYPYSRRSLIATLVWGTIVLDKRAITW